MKVVILLIPIYAFKFLWVTAGWSYVPQVTILDSVDFTL